MEAFLLPSSVYFFLTERDQIITFTSLQHVPNNCKACDKRRTVDSYSLTAGTFSKKLLLKLQPKKTVLQSKLGYDHWNKSDNDVWVPRSETRGRSLPAASQRFQGAESTNCCSSPAFLPPCTCSGEQRQLHCNSIHLSISAAAPSTFPFIATFICFLHDAIPYAIVTKKTGNTGMFVFI